MSATPIPRPHLLPIRILPEDIDFMGHVNNARYLTWVQDAVLSHWRKLAPSDAVARHAWVALRHEITYRKPAFLADDIVARTVLQKVAGARAIYHTVIARLGEMGEEVLAEVSSMWCCLDVETRRPARIDRALAEGVFGLAREKSVPLTR